LRTWRRLAKSDNYGKNKEEENNKAAGTQHIFKNSLKLQASGFSGGGS
jgi:hypothetical protein